MLTGALGRSGIAFSMCEPMPHVDIAAMAPLFLFAPSRAPHKEWEPCAGHQQGLRLQLPPAPLVVLAGVALAVVRFWIVPTMPLLGSLQLLVPVAPCCLCGFCSAHVIGLPP